MTWPPSARRSSGFFPIQGPLIDSAGVGTIVSLYKRMQVYGGALQVKGLRDQPLAIFKVLRLERVFDL